MSAFHIQIIAVCSDDFWLELNAALIQLDDDAGGRPLFYYLLSVLQPRARRATDCCADLSLSLALNAPYSKAASWLKWGLTLSWQWAPAPAESSLFFYSSLFSADTQSGYSTSVSCSLMSVSWSTNVAEMQPWNRRAAVSSRTAKSISLSSSFFECDADCDTPVSGVRLIGMNC